MPVENNKPSACPVNTGKIDDAKRRFQSLYGCMGAVVQRDTGLILPVFDSRRVTQVQGNVHGVCQECIVERIADEIQSSH